MAGGQRIFRTLTLSLAAAVCLASLSCDHPGNDSEGTIQAPPGGVLLRGAGSTFVDPLIKKWKDHYVSSHPKVAIQYDAVGSGAGVKRFIGKSRDLEPKDMVDFSVSEYAMTDAEMAEVSRGARLVPITAGALVLAYNLPDVVPTLKLSREAYAGIFLGTITEWNDPRIAKTNPGVKLPKLSIALVARQDASGTTFALANHLSAISPEWRDKYGAHEMIDFPGAMRVSGSETLAGRIDQSAGSIGYVQYGFALRVGLRMAILENKAGKFIKPGALSGAATLAAIQFEKSSRVFVPDPVGENSYPIVTMSWALLYEHYDRPEVAAAVHDFFAWSLANGQGYAESLGYVPLPANVLTRSQLELDTLASTQPAQ